MPEHEGESRVKSKRKRASRKIDGLTKTERRILAIISRSGGAYLDRSFDPGRYFALNGRELPERTTLKLVTTGHLVAAGDSLFSGDTQSFVPAAHG